VGSDDGDALGALLGWPLGATVGTPLGGYVCTSCFSTWADVSGTPKYTVVLLFTLFEPSSTLRFTNCADIEPSRNEACDSAVNAAMAASMPLAFPVFDVVANTPRNVGQ